MKRVVSWPCTSAAKLLPTVTQSIHCSGAAFADQAPPGESPYEIELTRQLFASNDYLPKLSLVAVAGDEIVGFVIGTRGWVGPVEAVGLGPLAVTPDNQRSGVGSALMHAVIGASDALDVPLLALLGSTEYYPQFGFVTSTDAGIESPEAEWGRALSDQDPHHAPPRSDGGEVFIRNAFRGGRLTLSAM